MTGSLPEDRPELSRPVRWIGWPEGLVGLAIACGLALIADGAGRSSATYDEVTYLRVAARWWRTGDQAEIARMGSPATFWKLQQAPVLWLLDHAGRSEWVDDPIGHQAELLPWVRVGGSWIWAVALIVTAAWARRVSGRWGMALASWIFALEPNLLAHGGLATMEMPLTACAAGAFLLFDRFLETRSRRDFWASAAVCGLGFACKFTAVLLPPLLGVAWWDRLRRSGVGWRRATWRVAIGMVGFGLLMVVADLVVTGFAAIPPSPTRGEHPALDGRFPAAVVRLAERPWPQDWVAFAVQTRHQRSGGPSYLFGERRMNGWWYYYFVAIAVKLPLGFWLLLAARGIAGRRADPSGRGRLAAILILGFMTITALGSSRNYGVRYLLPIAPAAIVWASSLASGPAWGRRTAGVGLAGMAAALIAIHPHELTYFNLLGGGAEGGRRILADSNLDWGQGARALARLQVARPEFRDITVYYFGETDPAYYGVVGVRHVVDAGTVHPGLPDRPTAETRFLAVSASLQHGPWGPPGYFNALSGIEPMARTEDGTISIYRSEAIAEPGQ